MRMRPSKHLVIKQKIKSDMPISSTRFQLRSCDNIYAQLPSALRGFANIHTLEFQKYLAEA
jgi:hypothetical protein